ncbi:MAG TPA: STAS domain-containing protein [Gaiellaceae bacterium]|nr:STAS domain-containing protein [Gaiellaceae bacterium]
MTRTAHGELEVVALAGELDMASAPAVTEALDDLADMSARVVVDFTELSFIDSSGIHAVFRPKTERTIVGLVCPPGNVSRVLEVTKIDRVLPVYGTLDAALAGLA